MFFTRFISKNQIAGFFMSGALVENWLNYFFHVCFFFKKNLLYLLVLVGNLFMEWSHVILNMYNTKLLIDPIIC